MTDKRLCAVTDCGRPMPTGDNSTACPACWTRLDRDLGEIPSLVNQLEITLSRQTSTGESVGARSAEAPLPYSTAASDALRLLWSTLWPWAREGITAHPQVYVSQDIVGLGCALLTLHGWLVTHPDGNQAIEEIGYATGQARQAIDRAPDRTYAGTCNTSDVSTECGTELYALDGQATITCPTCGAERDVRAWRMQRLADAADQLLTLTEMSRAIAETQAETISRKRLEGWVRRGRLLRSGNVGAIPTYRVGDVLDILLDEQSKRAS